MDPEPIYEEVLWDFSVINDHESKLINDNLEDINGYCLLLGEVLSIIKSDSDIDYA